MVKINNLENLGDELRKEIANSPALLDFMVAASGVRPDLVAEVRAAPSVDEAQKIAKAANVELKAVQGKTVDDVYAATGTNAKGPGGLCITGTRWDPITQTCVPI